MPGRFFRRQSSWGKNGSGVQAGEKSIFDIDPKRRPGQLSFLFLAARGRSAKQIVAQKMILKFFFDFLLCRYPGIFPGLHKNQKTFSDSRGFLSENLSHASFPEVPLNGCGLCLAADHQPKPRRPRRLFLQGPHAEPVPAREFSRLKNPLEIQTLSDSLIFAEGSTGFLWGFSGRCHSPVAGPIRLRGLLLRIRTNRQSFASLFAASLKDFFSALG